jgi:hypothetical protein
MKTILLGKYMSRLASLNDQLCFFQFNRNELNRRLAEFGANVGRLYTPDVFAQNAMAPRINVTIADLPAFQNLNQTFTFGAYISTSYEVVSYYLRDSLELLHEFNPLTFQQTEHRQLEEKYSLTLVSSNCTPVPREVIDTLKYIRLRRNHFTHLAETVDTTLETLIINSGNTLNAFWAAARTHLDFSSINVLTFQEEETIDVLKILRIIVQTLDTNLAPNLTQNGIVTFLANREYATSNQRKNNDIFLQRIQRIKTLCDLEFGIIIPENIIDTIVRAV